MDKVTRVLIWLIVLGLIVYFVFLPIDVTRKKTEKISPVRVY